MIDTHCHLLPGLDDGPRTMPESVVLARALVAAGVTATSCTPHFSRRYPTAIDDARDAWVAVKAELAAESIPLATSLAAELSPVSALDADDGDLVDRQMKNGYLLVELEPDTPSGAVELILERLEGVGLLPVLAHPERCRSVREQPRILDSARAAGALVQTVARSLGRGPASNSATAALDFLDAGRVDLIASDSHSAAHAGDSLATVLADVERRYGVDALERLTRTTPSRLVFDRSVDGG